MSPDRDRELECLSSPRKSPTRDLEPDVHGTESTTGRNKPSLIGKTRLSARCTPTLTPPVPAERCRIFEDHAWKLQTGAAVKATSSPTTEMPLRSWEAESGVPPHLRPAAIRRQGQGKADGTAEPFQVPGRNMLIAIGRSPPMCGHSSMNCPGNHCARFFREAAYGSHAMGHPRKGDHGRRAHPAASILLPHTGSRDMRRERVHECGRGNRNPRRIRMHSGGLHRRQLVDCSKQNHHVFFARLLIRQPRREAP